MGLAVWGWAVGRTRLGGHRFHGFVSVPYSPNLTEEGTAPMGMGGRSALGGSPQQMGKLRLREAM